MWREGVKTRRAAKLEQKKLKAKAWSSANLKAARSVQKTAKYQVATGLDRAMTRATAAYLKNDA